jgi:hypothetical protein
MAILILQKPPAVDVRCSREKRSIWPSSDDMEVKAASHASTLLQHLQESHQELGLRSMPCP